MTLTDRPETEHSATELLEVERLTTALSADWLEQYGVLPLRLDEVATDGLSLVFSPEFTRRTTVVRLLLWSLPPSAVWLVYLPYGSRYLSPAWPGCPAPPTAPGLRRVSTRLTASSPTARGPFTWLTS